MLTTEAMVLSVIGAVIGVTLGVVFGLLAARTINDDVVLRLPYGQIALLIVASGLAGVVAAILPARRATRATIVSSLVPE